MRKNREEYFLQGALASSAPIQAKADFYGKLFDRQIFSKNVAKHA